MAMRGGSGAGLLAALPRPRWARTKAGGFNGAYFFSKLRGWFCNRLPLVLPDK